MPHAVVSAQQLPRLFGKVRDDIPVLEREDALLRLRRKLCVKVSLDVVSTKRTPTTYPFHDVRGRYLPELGVVLQDVEVRRVVPLLAVRRRAKVQLPHALSGQVQPRQWEQSATCIAGRYGERTTDQDRERKKAF